MKQSQGQSRYAAGRIYVHDDIYDKFVKRSVDLARKRIIGDSYDKTVKHTTMIDEKTMKNFLDLVEMAKKEGAKLEFGGKRHGTKGFYVEPTILTDVSDDMRIAREKVFGPMKIIMRFRKIDDILDLYDKIKKDRLVGGVITKNMEKFTYITRRLDTGLIWLNTWHDLLPHVTYGERKDMGTMLGHKEVYDYLKIKTIHGHFDTKKFDLVTY